MRISDTDARTADKLVGDIVLLLRNIVYAPEAGIAADTPLADLGLDSLDLVEAGLELEALLGRDLPAGALAIARTVGDLARCFAPPAMRPGLSLAA